jgi:ADP-heptose:LPS heptosyltransferase
MVIVIRLPDSMEDRFHTFPFLHQLKRHFQQLHLEQEEEQEKEREEGVAELEIHFITHKNNIDILNLLPFKAYYHELMDEDILSVFAMHRFCVNAKILKEVDYFFCLTSSIVDATIGYNLKAKYQVGFKDGIGTMLFKQRTMRSSGLHKVEEYLKLLSEFTKADYHNAPKVFSRRLDEVIPERDLYPYITVNLSVDSEFNVKEEWQEFFEFFENKKFILFCDQIDTNLQRIKIEMFIKKLNPKNIYEIREYDKDHIYFAKIFSYTQAFISYEGPLVHLASYTGAHSFVIFDKSNPQLSAPLYFLGLTKIYPIGTAVGLLHDDVLRHVAQ